MGKKVLLWQLPELLFSYPFLAWRKLGSRVCTTSFNRMLQPVRQKSAGVGM